MRSYVKRSVALISAVALLGVNQAGPAVRRIDGRIMVAVQPLANQLGIPVRHANGALSLQVDGTWVQIRPNDITLREGDSPVVRLNGFPLVRDGRLFVDVADLSTVLDVDANVTNGRVIVARKPRKSVDSSDSFSVSEVATPRPIAKPSQAPNGAQHVPKVQIGTISASVFDYGQQTNYNALVDGGGNHFHATLYVNGMVGTHPTIGGTVRIGDAGRRHLSLGGINDPLYGSIFTGGGANGIEGVNAAGTFASLSTTTIDARHVIAFGTRSTQWVREIALASQGGVLQPLIGVQHWNETSKYIFDQEVWTGLHGIGAGLRYRTTGRLYTDLRLAIAGAGLPLVTGDALTQATVGYDLTPIFGIRAGYGVAHAQGGLAVVELYGGTRNVGFTLSHYGTQNNATLDFSRFNDNLRLQYIEAPGYHALQGDGSFDALRGVVETRTYLASDSTDLAADYRFKREAPSLTLGVESVRAQSGGRIGPTFGYLFPVGNALSVGFEFHPLANGNGIRFTAAQSLFMRPVTARRSVTVDLPPGTGTGVYLLVDGVRTQRLQTQSTPVEIETGSHYLALESLDGRFGSPEQRVVDGSPRVVSLPLWPVSEVRGVLHLSELPLGLSKPSLGGITVLLLPQGVATQTESDGSFSFPAQPLDPSTRLSVDSDSLPKGVAAGDPQPIEIGKPATILLHPTTKVEKVIF